MTREIRKANFDQYGFSVEGRRRKLEITDELLATLTRLIGWNPTKEQFELIRADKDGKLEVSSGALQTNVATDSQITATSTAQNILSENADRKQYMIQNIGVRDVYLAFGETATVAKGLKLPADYTWIDDVWYGSVSAICDGSDSTDLVAWSFE